MIKNYNQIENLFRELSACIDININLFIIGGLVMLKQELKESTKDIDIIVDSESEFFILEKAFKRLGFKSIIPGIEYENMNLSQIFERDDFRIDLFNKKVCDKFSLSKDMIKRAGLILDFDKLKVFHCSNEDVLLFKTMTEREGDLDDCMKLVIPGIDWSIILKELKDQISLSGRNIWITWVGERLDLLEDKGLVIPIMKDVNKLRKDYYDKLDN